MVFLWFPVFCVLVLSLPLPLRTASAASVDEASRLLSDGKDEEAKALLSEVVAADPRDAEANFLLGRIYMRQQDYEQATKYVERAVDLAGSVSDYHLWLARCYLGKAMKSGLLSAFRHARKGKGEYEKAVELDPENTDARLELCLYLLAAPGVVGGDKDEARKHAATLRAQDEIAGTYAWASVWEMDKDIAKAESLYLRAVEIDTSTTFRALYALGHFYERYEKSDQAVRVFKDILAKNADERNALFQIGRTYVITKTNLEEAERIFRTYLEKPPPPNAPSHAAARWRLGMVYDLQGRNDLALAELKQAAELEPDNEQFKETLKAVEKKARAEEKARAGKR